MTKKSTANNPNHYKKKTINKYHLAPQKGLPAFFVRLDKGTLDKGNEED